MSHEIRTPMNGVIGMTELALMEPVPPRAAEYLRLVKQSGLALLEIINDILDLSKIEAGKVELDRRPFLLREAVEAALKPLELIARHKGLEFLQSIDPEVPDPVLGDSGRLRQILTNIVGNAVKFTEAGRVAVSVSLAEDSPAGRACLLFMVKDDGIGIPADRLAAVFEPFAQAGGSAHVKYGGTGLGLSISRELVEAMGGAVRANSMPGRGSTFHFSVLLDLSEAPVEQPSAPQPVARPQGATLRVLLVEDNQVNRILGIELLERRGHLVETAENGREALDRLRSGVFDLVLMDIRMPVMDGEEATRRIRAGEAGPDNAAVPVVALTAHALAGDRERFLATGMDDFLSKPLDLADLDRVLEQLEQESARTLAALAGS
jgi:two-component system CheB/CheR fusion protein